MRCGKIGRWLTVIHFVLKPQRNDQFERAEEQVYYALVHKVLASSSSVHFTINIYIRTCYISSSTKREEIKWPCTRCVHTCPFFSLSLLISYCHRLFPSLRLSLFLSSFISSVVTYVRGSTSFPPILCAVVTSCVRVHLFSMHLHFFKQSNDYRT